MCSLYSRSLSIIHNTLYLPYQKTTQFIKNCSSKINAPNEYKNIFHVVFFIYHYFIEDILLLVIIIESVYFYLYLNNKIIQTIILGEYWGCNIILTEPEIAEIEEFSLQFILEPSKINMGTNYPSNGRLSSYFLCGHRV